MPGEVLMVLLIVLTVVTVVGHLIWIGLAGLFRALLGVEKPGPRGPGRPPESAGADELSDLRAMARQLARMERLGLLDVETVKAVRCRAGERYQRLAGPAGAGAPQSRQGMPPQAEESEKLPQLDVGEAKKPLEPAAPRAPGNVLLDLERQRQARRLPERVDPTGPAVRTEQPVAVAERVPAAAKGSPAAPARPRMSFAQILESFMEERNIRWGELIGGLLMVTSAVCLVISLRKTLEQYQFLQFSVGVALVSACFGLGLYAFHRWRLATTSRALLIVSNLLVPLYFFATARLSKGQWHWTTLLTEGIALAVFAWLVDRASRVLLERGRFWQVLGVMGGSVTVLSSAALASPGAMPLVALGVAPVGLFAAAMAGLLFSTRRREGQPPAEPAAINSLLAALGVCGFSLAAALGMLLLQGAKVAGMADTLQRFSGLVALSSIVVLAGGMALLERTGGRPGLGMQHLTATLVAMFGGVLLVVSLGLAWPHHGLIAVLSAAGAAGLLAMQLRWRRPALLAACQGLLATSAVAGTTAWLQRHPWGTASGVDLGDPRSWQAYGVGLLAFSLVWLLARITIRGSRVGLLRGPWWTRIDRFVALGVAAGQFALVGWHTWLGCAQELQLPGAVAGLLPNLTVFGPAAWLLVGMGAAWTLVSLWNRWREPELLTAILTGTTVACLVGGSGSALAASTLRWSLAAWFLIGSAVVWARGPLRRASGLLRARVRLGLDGPSLARTAMVLAGAIPVVGFTVLAAILRLQGLSPVRPLPGTFFAEIGASVSYLVPLAAVFAGLVGYALRERSTGYAFSAGLVAEMASVLGYLLYVVLQARAVGDAERVVVLQCFALTASVWAAIWLVARRWVDVWREEGERVRGMAAGRNACRTGRGGEGQSAGATWLMRVQLGMAVFGNLALIGPALLSLALSGRGVLEWATETGSWLGWLTLIAAVAAVTFRRLDLGKSLQAGPAGLVGMAALGLLACSVRALWPAAPEWGYRTLMFGWAMYSLFLVLATSWIAQAMPGRGGPPRELIRAVSGWVSAAGLLAVLLGIRLAVFHDRPDDLLWAAGSIAVASLACASMAVWRRREGWALAAAPGVNLAASLVVWYCQWRFRPYMTFDDWWLLLVQANVMAIAAVALVWLSARRRLYELGDLSLRSSPLLAFQISLGLLGNALLLAPAVLRLLAHPASLPGWMGALAEPAGWLALGLALASAGWYLWQVAPGTIIHVFGALGLGTGVLLACLAAKLGTPPATVRLAWAPYHILTWSWAALALLMLTVGWLGRRWRARQPAATEGQVDAAETSTVQTGQLLLPAAATQFWVTLFGLVAVLLSLLWCHADPDKPVWSLEAIVVVMLAWGLTALWLRKPSYVFASGLLVNLGGLVLLQSGLVGGGLPTQLQIHAACLGLAAALWSLVGMMVRRGVPVFDVEGRAIAFSPLATWLGILVLGVTIGCHWCSTLVLRPALPWFDGLGWGAMATLAAALVLSAWDRQSRVLLPGLYAVGLLAVAALLPGAHRTPQELGWTACLMIAAFVLAAAIMDRLLPLGSGVWRRMQIPVEDQRFRSGWFSAAQMLLGGMGAVLAASVAIDFGLDGFQYAAIPWIAGRWAGAVASAALLATALVMGAPRRTDAEPAPTAAWQSAALVMLSLLLATTGWSLLSPQILLPSLHRNVILLTALLATAAIGSALLPYLLPGARSWVASGRRTAQYLTALAGAILLVVLGQEVYFNQPRGTPVALPAILAVGGLLAAMVVVCLWFALDGRRDPLRLSDAGRQGYVYAAEVLVFLVCVHLRLTVPKLFEFGIVEKYWMLIVLGVAFLGAGLAEIFQRRGLPVLSRPLERTAALLPLIPAVGFWFPTQVPREIFLAGPKPAIWFLAALFYTIRAVTRRSGLATIFSVIAVSVGFGVLWQQHAIGFFDRPQLWVIPMALAVLIAQSLNQSRLTEAENGTLRYVATSLIYISTCADLFFIHGFAQSMAVPLALLILSVVGVLAGIVLRIRSFLALGSAFLVVSLAAMVYHAAFDLDQKWVLWASICALGLAILAVFGLAERHRNALPAAVQRLKQWER